MQSRQVIDPKVFAFLQNVLDDFCWCVSDFYYEGEFDVVVKLMTLLSGEMLVLHLCLVHLIYGYFGVR